MHNVAFVESGGKFKNLAWNIKSLYILKWATSLATTQGLFKKHL